MFGLPIGLLIKIGIAIAIAAALYALWYSANHWHNAAWNDEHKIVLDQQARIAAADRKSENLQASLDASAAAHVTELKANEEKHDGQVAQLRSENESLRGRTLHLSGDLLRMQQRASDLANKAAGAAPAPQGTDGPATTLPVPSQAGALVTIDEADLANVWNEAGAAYGAAAIRLRTCVRLYNAAREAQLQSNLQESIH